MGTVASIERKDGHSTTIISNSSLENATMSQADWMEISDEESEKEVTQEEPEIWKGKIFNDLNENINKIKQIPCLRDDKGNWNDDLLTSLSVFSDIYSNFNTISHLHYDDIRKYRRKAGKRLSESPTNIMCKVIIKGWKRGYRDKNGIITYDIAGQPKFLETLKQILTTLLPKHMEGKTEKEDEDVIINCLGIFHNISMEDQNIPRLRSLEIKKMYHLTALATLADIIDEQESAILKDKPDVVVYLLETLESAIQNKNHRDKGWSAQECAKAVRGIARNDANKKILVRLGCLQHLVELTKKGNSKEQKEAVEAISFLAFERENHSKIMDDKQLNIIDLLDGLKKEHKGEDIIKDIDRLFWILREELEKNDQYKHIVRSFEQKKRHESAAKGPGNKSGATVKNKKGHVMISYNWDNQAEVKKIYSFLKEYYYVWLDIIEMKDSTLQAMASGVEAAHVVLVCMSQKYKDSPNCRLEAEYAHKLNKNIIPLKMERRYEPDGWLGILTGTQLYYEFSGKYPFEVKLKDLLLGIQHCYESEDVKPRGVAVKSPLEKTVAVIREWTPDRVNKWIEEQRLPKGNFREFTSRELALLVTMRSEAPEFVYNCLQKNLGIDSLETMAILIEGLEDLLSKDLQDLSA
ncbi:hypothetical protein ACJMK2_014868 [Sinanodonta woodiana]|uniref:TIR domain-containing protein n=1 Tax=Sinanodonta woodiana TaxID=1069815 RepID=A0ABD3V3W3_SINWO